MPTIQDLEEQIARLEFRIRKLVEIADSSIHPFTYLALESNLDEHQFRAIFDLMDRTGTDIQAGQQVSRGQFEQDVYAIVPSHNGDYHFVESIVSTLNDSSQYTEVYNYMKTHGMNI